MMSSSLKLRCVPCLLAISMLAPRWAGAEPVPAAERSSSFPLSRAAVERIEPIPAQKLLDDTTFVSTLAGVLNDPGLQPADKVDAFFLMLLKIGWEFTGTVRIPPGFDYFRTFNSMAGVYVRYQRALQARGLAAAASGLAAGECGQNVVRCSHGLLLAAMVDPKTYRPIIRSYLAPDALQAAEVPAILLHNLSFAMVLGRDREAAMTLGRLLDSTESEESREDILCVLGTFAIPEADALVESFLRSAVRTKLDASVETGLAVLRQRLSPDAFAAFSRDLIAQVTSPESKARLQEMVRAGAAGPGASSSADQMWLKIWDGFSVVAYDDGLVITHGARFRDFKPR